jgi:hypothetical protein
VDLPTTADGFVVVDNLYNLDGAVASPGTPRGVFQYPSPSPMDIQPYVYPPNIMGPTMIQQNNQMQTPLPDSDRMPDLTALNVMQLDEPQPQQDVAMQSWVDGTYAAGYRNQAPHSHQASADRPTGQEQPHNNTMLASQRLTLLGQYQQPRQTTSQPPTSTASLGYLQCDHPGCRTTCPTRGALNHHIRYHTPADRRPHQCSLCPQRFLHPREVRRHMSTHGIGPRHLCPIPRCPWAIRGFGRRDHLLRHLRRFHVTPS